MKSDFIIFPLCITLIQIILVKVSPTFAVIHKENINDIQLLRKYREASSLQLKKGVEMFFPHNLQGYLTKAGLKDIYSNEENKNGTEICANRVLARAMGAVDATFAAALIANPEMTSAAMSARPALVDGLLEILRDLCCALELAVGNKSPTTAAKIQAITDKVLPAAAAWNLQFFNAIGAGGQLKPEIALVLKEAQVRATNVLGDGFKETLIGLQKLAALDLRVESEEISTIMDTFRNRAFSKYFADSEEKLDASETLLITPPTTGSDHGAYSSANQYKTVAIQCGAHNASEMARLQIKKGYFTWINTIQHLLHKTSAKSSSGSQNDHSESGTAKKETIAVFNSAIDAAMNAVFQIHPECSSIVRPKRDVAVGKMQRIVHNIYNSIDSIRSTDPRKALTQLKVSEMETISGASGVVSDLFDGILDCSRRAVGIELRTSVQPELEKSIIKIKELFRIIFTAIRVRIVEISSRIQTKGKAQALPLKDTQAEASTSGKTAMQIIIDVIASFLEASTNAQFDKAASLSAVRMYREKISFKIEKGVDLIFSNIAISAHLAANSPSDIIKAGHSVTVAAYLIALRNLFCSSQIVGSKTIWVSGKEGFSLVQQIVDDKYMILNKAVGNESCELLSNLEVIKATLDSYHERLMSVIYDENRKRSNYDVEMEPAVSHAESMTISSVKTAIAVGLKAVETLASRNCPSSKTGSSNILSPFIGDYNKAFSKLDNFIQDLTHGVRSTVPMHVDNVFERISAITSGIQASFKFKPLVPLRFLPGGL